MASNTRTFADASGDFEDWIEIYNPSSEPVNLSGYFLSDDTANLKKHKLSASGNQLVIAAKGYLILWASSNTGKGVFHLGFGLSAGGESVSLVAPDGLTVLDRFSFGPQKQDISQGRFQNGAGSWVFFSSPTPGGSNNVSQGYLGFLNPPVFSQSGGFYTDKIELAISAAQPDVTIIYTLDGSEPDTGSLGGKAYSYKNSYPGMVGDPFGPLLYDTLKSFIYAQPVVLNDRTSAEPDLANKSSTVDANPYIPPSNFFKGTTVRARVVRDGYLASDVITHTYFITPKGINRYSLPVAAVTLPANQLFGYQEGIYNAGKLFDNWRAKEPLETNLFRAKANFNQSGEAYERIGHFEYFRGNSNVINQSVGVRLHGSSGRYKLIKALRLYARSELGKSTFDHHFFAGYPFNKFKRLLLRPDDWDRTTILDLAVQHLAKGLKFDIQEGQPSILFINGEYWGLHSVRERYDRYYFELKYGIKDGELDLLEDNSLVEEGDNKDYLAIRNFIKTRNLSEPANYEYVKSKIDLENYTDYFINGMFIANRDWPENNIRYYRKNTPSPAGAPAEQDGRWRWLLFDTDASYTGFQASNNYFERIIPIETVFLKEFFTMPGYRDYFINRYADLLNTVYGSSLSIKKIDSIAELVKPFVPEHRYRLFKDSATSFWSSGIQDMKNFARRRPDIVRQHIKQYFNLGDTQRITIHVLQPEMGFVSVNTLDLKAGTPGVAQQPYPWQGIYFKGMPVTLIARPLPGYRFVKWQGDTSLIKDTLIVHLNKAVRIEAVFEPDSISGASRLIHYWHFNNLPSGTLQSIAPDSTLLVGAQITYTGTGNGYMDRVSGEGSSINAQYNQAAGTALRVRNPSNTRELIMKTPTTGFDEIGLGWATIRTGSGAQEQRVLYSTNEGNTNWTEWPGVINISESYQYSTFSLKGIAAAKNNPYFAVKVLFSGSNATGSSGNNRFDNITVTGRPIEDDCGGNKPRWWFRDTDNDGFSDGSRVLKCSPPEGYKLLSSLSGTVVDCNDADSLERPDAKWFKDADNDGYTDGAFVLQCKRPSGYKGASELKAGPPDCNDADAIFNPTTKWYRDSDGDGYGDGTMLEQCNRPDGFFLGGQLKAVTGDCNDMDHTLNPETAWYKDMDEDGYTDGVVLKQCLRPPGHKGLKELSDTTLDCNDNDRGFSPETVWYNDTDADGYSNGQILLQCNRPAGYKLPGELKSVLGDCDEKNALLNPETKWYKDIDNDGYSDGTTLTQCLQPSGYKLPAALKGLTNDCNDTFANLNPETVWFKDKDGDGYGDGTTRVQCERPGGYYPASDLLKTTGDCNDEDPEMYPGAVEFPDNKDNDCNGMTDEGPPLDVRVAPNPVQQELRLILLVFMPNQKITFSVTGTDGKVYRSGTLQPVQFGQIMRFDVRNMASGTYILQVKQGDHTITRKILVVR